jgi:hypothetical protein
MAATWASRVGLGCDVQIVSCGVQEQMPLSGHARLSKPMSGIQVADSGMGRQV